MQTLVKSYSTLSVVVLLYRDRLLVAAALVAALYSGSYLAVAMAPVFAM